MRHFDTVAGFEGLDAYRRFPGLEGTMEAAGQGLPGGAWSARSVVPRSVALHNGADEPSDSPAGATQTTGCVAENPPRIFNWRE